MKNNIRKNILYSLFSLQEKFLRFKLSRTIGIKSSSKRKHHYGNGYTLNLESLAEAERNEFETEITNILKSNNYEPDSILNYIKKQGTSVYYIPKAKNILNPIGENEGFIYPAKGTRALYLSLGILKKPKLKTDEMFVLSKGKINKYYFLYHFYNWYAFKKGISGIDTTSQELLKKYLFTNSDTKELQLDDIYKLKDAIQQDKAAIEFVIKLSKNYEGAKNALEKLQNGGAKL